MGPSWIKQTRGLLIQSPELDPVRPTFISRPSWQVTWICFEFCYLIHHLLKSMIDEDCISFSWMVELWTVRYLRKPFAKATHPSMTRLPTIWALRVYDALMRKVLKLYPPKSVPQHASEKKLFSRMEKTDKTLAEMQAKKQPKQSSWQSKGPTCQCHPPEGSLTMGLVKGLWNHHCPLISKPY